MNSKLVNLAFLTVGVSIGVASTWYYFKNKYEEQAKIDLDERLNRQLNSEVKKKVKFKQDIDNSDEMGLPTDISADRLTVPEKPNLGEYANMVKKMDYSSFSNENKTDEPSIDVVPDDDPDDPPYIINPDDFGDHEEYDLVTLTYYSDGVLTDQDDELIEDIDGMVGYEALSRFKDFKIDCLYVRNDRLGSDYEIISDLRRFDDVLSDGLRHRR
ncbi:MAG: hypothetical protein K9L62_02020 [Vallitaleaceae bacterium]|nr:hypothetical protein [Vallitaleaceae bacterium]